MIETRSAWWCAAAILVGGCATTPLPEGIGAAPPGNPDYERVRVDTGAHAGEAVRWGGAVAGVERSLIGEFDYAFPVVEAQSLYLWQRRVDPGYTYPPLWFDPWYPWWPTWHRFPYRYHHHTHRPGP